MHADIHLPLIGIDLCVSAAIITSQPGLITSRLW